MPQILSQLPLIVLGISAIIFVFAILKQVLYWSWFWQLKEYRMDRMRAHFQDVGGWTMASLLSGYPSLRRNRKPEFTKKASLIVIISFVVTISAAVYAARIYLPWFTMDIFSSDRFTLVSSFDPAKFFADPSVMRATALILLDEYGPIIEVMVVFFLFAPLAVFFSVIILNFVSSVEKARIVSRAKEKMKKFPNLKVVGITGSYGKSTTKEILAEILSKKYKVLKTPANINTPIGISQLILDKLDENYDIFIVEMGAYTVGEIKEICDIVKPKIGIITAINEQHLALFGTIENTVKAKFELIQALPSDGLAILNVGDKNVQAGLEKENCTIGNKDCGIKAKIKQYSVGAKADVYAINVANSFSYVKFRFISGADMMDFKLNITGAHNISNALAAIIASRELGMNLSEISMAIQRIGRLGFTLNILPGPNGSTLIDDTYNSNPDGVMAAIDYIENQRGRKFVIMSPLIELGSAAHKVHHDLGKKISGVAVKLVFLDNYYVNDIKKGAEENKNSIVEIKVDRNVQRIAKMLENEMKPSDIALFLNRRAGLVLELLKK